MFYTVFCFCATWNSLVNMLKNVGERFKPKVLDQTESRMGTRLLLTMESELEIDEIFFELRTVKNTNIIITDNENCLSNMKRFYRDL